ncbi:MAG TPA: 2-oxo acid dehydrogenase subunit E2, partial [Vicinamibacteria bacterium]
ITELETLRERYAARAEAVGGKLTVTAIALKIAASALNVFPKFATALDTDNDELVYRAYRHVGVAVDTERGLLVPVIRDVDQKSIVELSRELTQIADRAREGKLSIDEMRGGVFTITNLGGIGGTSFNPIVNWPEVAILGLSRSAWKPVTRNHTVEPRLYLPLSLSYDHRVIDGAEAARFLHWVTEAFESPFLLSLEG